MGRYWFVRFGSQKLFRTIRQNHRTGGERDRPKEKRGERAPKRGARPAIPGTAHPTKAAPEFSFSEIIALCRQVAASMNAGIGQIVCECAKPIAALP
jgi:hypothetical protein